MTETKIMIGENEFVLDESGEDDSLGKGDGYFFRH